VVKKAKAKAKAPAKEKSAARGIEMAPTKAKPKVLTKGNQQLFKFLSRLPLSRLQTTRLCLYLRQGSLQVFIVAALNRFRVAEIEGIHPQGM
jgi:hypothetical protein